MLSLCNWVQVIEIKRSTLRHQALGKRGHHVYANPSSAPFRHHFRKDTEKEHVVFFVPVAFAFLGSLSPHV